MTFEEFRAEIHARWPEAVTRDDSDQPGPRYCAYLDGLDVLRYLDRPRPWVCVHGHVCESGTTLDDALADVRAGMLWERDRIDETLAVLDGRPSDGQED